MSVDPLFQPAPAWMLWWLSLVIDATVKGTAVLLLAWLAMRALRRSSASVRQAVWLLAIATLPALPFLAAAMPDWRVLPAWADPQAAFRQPAFTAAVPAGSPAGSRPAAVDGLASPGGGTRPVADRPPPAPAQVLPPSADEQLSFLVRAAPWAVIVWVAGALVCLTPLILGRISLWRIEQKARPAGAPWAVLAKEAARQLGLRRSVSIRLTDRRAMPMVWGLVRPRLFLPAESKNWARSRHRAVLLHELAHVKRLDCLAKLVAHLACSLYWFNPLAWLAARQMETEAEAACDDLVLSGGARPSDYAEHLLEVVVGADRLRVAAPSAIALARSGGLESRLLHILNDGCSRRRLTRLGLAAAAALVAVVVLPLSMLRAVAAEHPVPVLVVSPVPAPDAAAKQEVDNDFTRQNPGYRERCGTFYEKEYLGKATDQLAEAAGLDAAQKAGARTIMRDFIYDWIGALIRDNGRITEADVNLVVWAMDNRFKAVLPVAKYELYLEWRQGRSAVGNTLMFLMKWWPPVEGRGNR